MELSNLISNCTRIMETKPLKPQRRPKMTSTEAKIGTDRQDIVKEAADISAVQNRTELLELEDVSNFDRTALSESEYLDENSRSELHPLKNSSFAGDEEAENSKVPSSPSENLRSVVEKKSDEGEWKVTGKSTTNPPPKPPRKIKSPEYVSSDTNNSSTSESIISAYQDRMDSTAADVSISKYNDYLGGEDSTIAQSNATTATATSNQGSVLSTSPAPNKGLFTNIYETKGSPITPRDTAPSSIDPPGSETLELKSRIRVP